MASYPQSVEKLITAYEQPLPNLEALPGVPRIKLNEVISKLAYVYEKVRNSIDFREEHLLRRNAIERILRRRYLVENRKLIDAKLLVHELIRARYLPNDKLPESLIPIVQNYIDRYLSLLDHLQLHRTSPEDRKHIGWILSVASADVEERLSPTTREDALVEVMYGSLRQNIVLPDEVPTGQEQDVLVYLAMHRALLKSDEATLRYHLFTWAYPTWKNPDHKITEEVRAHFAKMVEGIEARINHPLSERMLGICRRYAISFITLADVLRTNPGKERELVMHPGLMDETVRKAMGDRVKLVRTRLRRTTVRSIVYIFITKMLLALLVELPIELIFFRNKPLLPLYINATFHPLLMAFIGLSAVVPGKENTERVVLAVREILNPSAPRQVFGKKHRPRRRRPITTFIFTVAYMATFVLSFGGIAWLLVTLQFTWISILIFLFFLSVISFFGMRVRQVVRDLVILDRRENLFMLLLDFFSLPILRVGRWFSKKIPKFNLFSFILDFIIEAPFKIFVEVVEEWFSFLREKRDEIG